MKARRTKRTNRDARSRRTGRLAGTRARVPEAEPPALRRQTLAVAGVLALLGCIAAAPHVIDAARVAVREAPFLLGDVRVVGLDRLDAATIGRVLDLTPGEPIVAVDVEAAAARLAAHPWVAEAHVSRLPPRSLRVRVREEVAMAVVQAGEADVPHAVNAAGTPFAPATEADVARLVHVALPSPPEVGTADPRLREALELSASLRAHGLEVPREVRLGLPAREESAQLRLRGFAPAIWIERERASQQIDALATLLASNLQTANEARLIDLRFAGRAVLWAGE